MGGVVWLPRIKHSIKPEGLNIERFAKNASSLPMISSTLGLAGSYLLNYLLKKPKFIAIFAKCLMGKKL